MRECTRSSDVEYHLERARAERDVAYRGDEPAADLHMRLSALHLHRALLLQAIAHGPVGNVHPFPSNAGAGARSAELPTVGGVSPA